MCFLIKKVHEREAATSKIKKRLGCLEGQEDFANNSCIITVASYLLRLLESVSGTILVNDIESNVSIKEMRVEIDNFDPLLFKFPVNKNQIISYIKIFSEC